MKREHDFVEKITDMKGPKYIYPNNGIVKYCSCVINSKHINNQNNYFVMLKLNAEHPSSCEAIMVYVIILHIST